MACFLEVRPLSGDPPRVVNIDQIVRVEPYKVGGAKLVMADGDSIELGKDEWERIRGEFQGGHDEGPRQK